MHVQLLCLFEELLGTLVACLAKARYTIYHQACFHLETCIFGPYFGCFVLHLNLSSQLQNGQNRAGSMA